MNDAGQTAPAPAGVAEAAAAAVSRALADPLAPGLYVVATPIGNLADITLRALAVLARADRILCEDTRHSLRLLDHYGIKGRLSPYHDHNAARERPRLLQLLAGGASVALISDAGTPLIADPGFKLVRAAIEAGHPVHSVPGPSAAIAALSVGGLPSDQFLFGGFLPARAAARRQRLAALAAIPATLIFYETAPRLAAALHDLGELMAGRAVVIARELTKRFEETVRGALPLAWPSEPEKLKGEFVLLIGPPPEAQADEAAIRAALADGLARMSVRDAVEEVVRTLRVPRRLVYSLALELQKV
jgi:16S rRNA (cytidine1402-2'-O)-methyltransferase